MMAVMIPFLMLLLIAGIVLPFILIKEARKVLPGPEGGGGGREDPES